MIKYLPLLIMQCCISKSELFPNSNASLVYTRGYHCWPYNVKVYSIEKIVTDSLFFTYPKDEFLFERRKCPQSRECFFVRWTPFNELEEALINSVKWDLNNNKEAFIPNQVLERIGSGDKIYFAGAYRFFKNTSSQENKVLYKVVLFFPESCELHVFQEVGH